MADEAEAIKAQKIKQIVQEATNQYDIDEHMENYDVENTALQRKLQSKSDALRIMRKEVERFRIERDQFKLMAETLQLRYSALTKQNGGGLASKSVSSSSNITVASLLRETRERNMNLTTEVESLKQKLCDLQGDIEILRVHEKRKVITVSNGIQVPSLLSNAEQQWKEDRADFICHLENVKRKNAQMAYDIKSLIDEKNEIVTERDAYKCKAHRLNHELRNALKANEKYPKLIDIDSIILENKFLHECLKNTENELEISKTTISKYKAMLETKKKKTFLRSQTTSTSDEKSILSHKHVKDMLEYGIELPTRTETVHDLKSLCLMLLDTLNDKNLALSHQRKANKMLAMKISELDRRIQLLMGKEWSDENKNGFSPAEALLHMYCPSSVDSTSTTEPFVEMHSANSELSTENTVEKSESPNLSCEVTTKADVENYDDAMSASSSQSENSLTSSEYGSNDITGCNIKTLASAAMYAYTTPSSSSSKDYNSAKNSHFSLPNSLIQERVESLRELPDELAQLVEKTLYELDMRDFEVENVSFSKSQDEENAAVSGVSNELKSSSTKDYDSDSSANETTV